MNRGLRGLYRVMLIMYRRSGTGQIPDLINFNIKWKADVMAHEFKARMIVEVIDIALGTGKQIIDTQHFMALLK